jgi:hypothetical protein
MGFFSRKKPDKATPPPPAVEDARSPPEPPPEPEPPKVFEAPLCTEERWCEIMGAMMAWAQSRADLEANLARYFQITRDDLNRFSLHWSESSDFQRMQEQANRQAPYIEKYLALPM